MTSSSSFSSKSKGSLIFSIYYYAHVLDSIFRRFCCLSCLSRCLSFQLFFLFLFFRQSFSLSTSPLPTYHSKEKMPQRMPLSRFNTCLSSSLDGKLIALFGQSFAQASQPTTHSYGFLTTGRGGFPSTSYTLCPAFLSVSTSQVLQIPDIPLCIYTL